MLRVVIECVYTTLRVTEPNNHSVDDDLLGLTLRISSRREFWRPADLLSLTAWS